VRGRANTRRRERSRNAQGELSKRGNALASEALDERSWGNAKRLVVCGVNGQAGPAFRAPVPFAARLRANEAAVMIRQDVKANAGRALLRASSSAVFADSLGSAASCRLKGVFHQSARFALRILSATREGEDCRNCDWESEDYPTGRTGE
jgi:hypothetical protein